MGRGRWNRWILGVKDQVASRGRWNCWSQGGKGHVGSRERGWNRPSQEEVKRTEELVGGGDVAGVRGVKIMKRRERVE